MLTAASCCVGTRSVRTADTRLRCSCLCADAENFCTKKLTPAQLRGPVTFKPAAVKLDSLLVTKHATWQAGRAAAASAPLCLTTPSKLQDRRRSPHDRQAHVLRVKEEALGAQAQGAGYERPLLRIAGC